MSFLLLLCGCNTVIVEDVEKDSDDADTAYNLSFTEEESDASYQVSGSTYITLGDKDVNITKGGTYILQGTLSDASIIVEVSEDEDVQLVLNDVTIEAGDFAGIYIVEGDEITITLADGTVNTISDSSAYTQIDSNSVDALIYSKADLTINGSGSLVLRSSYNHGIVSKDDLIITGGSYDIEVAGQGLSGKDCLMISDGSFDIVSGKDALKSDNSEDEYRGYVYISGGSFNIHTGADAIYGYNLVNIEGGSFIIETAESGNADSYKAIKSEYAVTISGGEFDIVAADDGIHSDGDLTISSGTFSIVSDDDGIHADALVQIDDGKFTISAHEGIEATYVLINGGDISISASDDGINAAQKVNTYTATFEMNDGYIYIEMGQGDTDAVDSNGYIYINGGTLDIYTQSPFDYDKGAEYNGGTIIVNGTQTNEISNQMMGGGFGGMQPGNNGNSDNGQYPGGTETPGSVTPPNQGENNGASPPGHH